MAAGQFQAAQIGALDEKRGAHFERRAAVSYRDSRPGCHLRIAVGGG